MRHSIYQQRGASGLGILFIMASLVFILFIGIKLFPAYLDQYNVASVLSSIEKEPNLGSKPVEEITQLIMKRLDINMVKDVTRDDIYVSQSGNLRIIEVDYQVKRKLFANIDLLIHFNNRAEVPTH